jgi:biopolymer transport protein ExbD
MIGATRRSGRDGGGFVVRFTNLGLGGRGEIKSDINVTPLIAVMLVLLINLMLIVPTSRDGSGLRIPPAANTVDKPDPETHDVTVVAITADRRIFLNDVPVREADLAANVAKSLDSKKDKTVLFEGDEEAPYSAVMAAVDILRKAQIKNISLIVREERGRSGSRDLH